MKDKPIAERTFKAADGAETTLRLFAPEADGEDWFCRVGIGEADELKVYGIDSLQALCLAVAAAKSQLRCMERNEAK